MEFLDNLILGKNTPRYADESTFPSKTYKKNLCRKKHCGTLCMRDTYSDWEFWAMFLTCKPINQVELGDKILNMKSCLRFSVWLRLIREDTKTKPIDIEIDKNNEERDKKILELILSIFRNKKIDEEELFNVLVSTFKGNVDNLEGFIDFIYNILDLPFADTLHLKEILEYFNGKLKLHEIFSEDVENSKEQEEQESKNDLESSKENKDTNKGDEEKTNTEENCNIKETTENTKSDTAEKPEDTENKRSHNPLLSDFVSHLISKDFIYFCRVIDLILCYRNTTIKEALIFLLNEKKDSDFKSLLSVHNLDKLKEYLSKKNNGLETSVEEKNTTPTYYDFIVVQNETIKAQEQMKIDFMSKIDDLEKRNRELTSSLDHFKEIAASLEQELSDYQDGYVKDISKMLDENKKMNDDLEKEVLRLKEELCKSKRSVR